MSVLEKILEEIENESKLAHEEMRRCASENPLQFDEAKGYARGVEYVAEIIRSHMNEVDDGWIPVDSDNQPKDEERVLVSFENFNMVLTARYKAEEGRTFLLDADDTDESFVSHDLYVSAWQPLPEAYKEGE